MKKKNKKEHSKSLRIVQYYFPQVTSVEDANKSSIIEVTQKDSTDSVKKNHAKCAYAVACKRTMKADGVMVSMNTAYVIYGKKALRYKVPESVTREIVSFDRNAGFAPGIYLLNKPSDRQKLGAQPSGRSGKSGGNKIRMRHVTTGIRTILGTRVDIT
jgi:hypothetical protein